MNDKRALYNEICAKPYDDTIRLAYADALEESGDETQAHYIRESIALQFPPDELSGFDNIIKWKQRFDQTQKILNEQYEMWLLENEMVANNYDFTDHKIVWSRGMPDKILIQKSYLAKTREKFIHGIDIEKCAWLVKGLPLTKIHPMINPRLMLNSSNRVIGARWRKRRDETAFEFYHGYLPTWLFDITLEEKVDNMVKRKDPHEIGTYDNDGNIITIEFNTVDEANDCMNTALCNYLRKRVYSQT